MRIEKVIVSSGLGGYYFDDLKAVKKQVMIDGHFLLGKPLTEGYKSVRQPGETISIMLLLNTGDIAVGDAAAIQYSGVVGRDPILLAEKYIPLIIERINPLVEGIEINSFQELANWFDNLTYNGKKHHTGIRYGFTQAFLEAVAIKNKLTKAEVIANEYGTEISKKMIPILAQSGDDRYLMVDKMIMKKVPVLPQGLFNHVNKIGTKGESLIDYVKWLKTRVEKFGAKDYYPTFHLDVYGTVGKIFDNDTTKIAYYLSDLEYKSSPYPLQIECPVDAGTRNDTMSKMKNLRQELKDFGSNIKIVADDWCNTLEDIKYFADEDAADMIQVKTPDLGGINNSIEAVLYCKKNNIKAFLGGTCNETDLSSRTTVHMALATQADQIYNKPGMSVDEGYMIVHNEMKRTIKFLEAREHLKIQYL